MTAVGREEWRAAYLVRTARRTGDVRGRRSAASHRRGSDWTGQVQRAASCSRSSLGAASEEWDDKDGDTRKWITMGYLTTHKYPIKKYPSPFTILTKKKANQ